MMVEGIEEMWNLFLQIQEFGLEFLADAAVLNLHGLAGNLFMQTMNLIHETLANMNAALTDLIDLSGDYNIVAYAIQEANQILIEDGGAEAANQNLPEEMMNEDVGGLILEGQEMDDELEEDEGGLHNDANVINQVQLIEQAGEAIFHAVDIILQHVDEIHVDAHALQANNPNVNVQISQNILATLLEIDDVVTEIQNSVEIDCCTGPSEYSC